LSGNATTGAPADRDWAASSGGNGLVVALA